MSAGSKILAALIVLIGTISFLALLSMNNGFRGFFWQVMSKNILYASVGAITIFAVIIAIGSWLWKRD